MKSHRDNNFLFLQKGSEAPPYNPSRESVAATLYLTSMPRNRTSSPQRFDTSLLDPDGLTTRGGLRDALRSVERVCYEDDSLIMEMIEGLICQPHIFEYITSSTFPILVITIHSTKNIPVDLDSKAFERLSKWVLAQFPTHGTSNVMDALWVKLLQRLSSSLMAVGGMVTVERCNELRGFRRKVVLSFGVLKELGGCTDLVLVDANVSTTNRKKQRVPARCLQLDPDPFDRMGIPVPATDHDARITYGEILHTLKGLLEVCISPCLARFERLNCFRATYSSSDNPEYQIYSSARSKSQLSSSWPTQSFLLCTSIAWTALDSGGFCYQRRRKCTCDSRPDVGVVAYLRL